MAFRSFLLALRTSLRRGGRGGASDADAFADASTDVDDADAD